MRITRVVPQLRTTDLPGSIEFYTTKLGFTLAFQHGDFYAGLRSGDQVLHLKRVDEPDPSIAHVVEGEHLHLYLEVDDAAEVAGALRASGVTLVSALHQTAWGTLELVLRDDQGHTIYIGQALASGPAPGDET